MQVTKHSSKGFHPGFETQGRCRKKTKTGTSMALFKGLRSSKKFLKRSEVSDHQHALFCKCLRRLLMGET